MKHRTIGRALLCAVAACAVLAGCGRQAASQPEARAQQTYAAAGEAIELPVTLAAPQTDGTLNTLLSGTVLSGAFTTVASCRTRDFCTEGAITVRVQAVPDAADSAQGAFSLWQLSGGAAQYLQTIHFVCDGSPQTYSFTGLDAAAQYRVVFSCTQTPAQRLSGVFAVEGVTQEVEEPDEDASGSAPAAW